MWCDLVSSLIKLKLRLEIKYLPSYFNKESFLCYNMLKHLMSCNCNVL